MLKGLINCKIDFYSYCPDLTALMKLPPLAGEKCLAHVYCKCCLSGEHISVEHWKEYRFHTVQYVLCPHVTLNREAGGPKQILCVQRVSGSGRERGDSRGQKKTKRK